jgi:uncharacterized protein with GYD domain
VICAVRLVPGRRLGHHAATRRRREAAASWRAKHPRNGASATVIRLRAGQVSPRGVHRRAPSREGGQPVPTYVMLANWTDQGARQVKESPRRVDTAKKALVEMGGEIKSLYMTMGDYDLIVTYEAPDDAVAARFTLLLGMMGTVRTRTLKAFPEAAYREIINSLG